MKTIKQEGNEGTCLPGPQEAGWWLMDQLSRREKQVRLAI